ncbi:MAG: Fis family transcriptional regulator [Verrucomicrobiales bacterium]|nr:Fis family transcriptional regulator [Verrucomicrobiales bacterium]
MQSTETNKNAPFQCLVVEDDLAFSSMVAGVVRDTGGEPLVCHSLAAAREAVAQKAFDLVLLDNHLPDGKGYDFHAQVSRRYPDAPIVMITGLPDLGEAITLTRNGLFDYLTKPVSIEALEDCLRRARLRLVQNNPTSDNLAWVGDSAAMHEVMQQLRQAGRHREATVLLTGETGTGKDLMARVLHQFTFGDTKAPFIGLNCAAIPGEMFEAELFGAERGAYTGADKRRQGLAAAAQGGTLFLDEIGEVSLALQSKLLRLLEAREFRPLGSTEVQSFTGRFVAATNKSLDDEVKAGRFREDLLYRLNVLTIEVPPLRKRSEDIPGLAELLLKQISEKYGRTKPMLKPEELAALQSHAFPGNVRELRNILERSLLKTPEDSRWLQLDGHWKGSPAVPQPASKPAAPQAATLPSNRDLNPLEEQEYRMIEEALREAKGGIRRAAAKLGLSPQSLLRRLEKWPELRNSAGV